MKNSMQGYTPVHPMIIFWLGVLTGAVIIGLVFFYRFVLDTDYQSAVLNFSKSGSSGWTLNSGDPAAGSIK